MHDTTKRIAGILFVGSVVVLAALSADARPPGPLTLSLQLNGEAVRATQADGGGQMLYATTTETAWTSVACGMPYKVVCPVTAVSLCSNPTSLADAGYGCSAVTSSPLYGEPIAAAGFLYVVTQDCDAGSKVIAAVSQTDAGVECPVFRMK